LKFCFASNGIWQSSWPLDLAVVQEAERLGFWGFLVPDQYMWDAKDLHVDSEEGINATLEPWLAMSYMAAKTEKIMLGTFVTPLPLRSPNMLAKMVTTLDSVSGGRTVLGVGAGATQKMFEAYSVWDDKATRAAKAEEGLELMMKLWTEERVTFEGKYYKALDAVLEPKPVQKPYPTLLFGGAGRRMLRLAGKYANICYIPPWTKLPRDDAVAYVRKEARKYNREDKIAFAYAFDYSTEGVIAPKYDQKLYFSKVEEAANKGCDYFMVPFRHVLEPPWLLKSSRVSEETNKYLEPVRQFAKDIMPSFSD
jgi:alkanesulfonate monooxygenase SsuD/methylene tetrahydromethanopterin reductase-like flavin-dependent oxidoreductase (luciferase family)